MIGAPASQEIRQRVTQENDQHETAATTNYCNSAPFKPCWTNNTDEKKMH